MRRIDELTEPPEVGCWYLVPCAEAIRYNGQKTWMPVIGPAHHDKEFLNFDRKHFHVDGRFLTKLQARRWWAFYESLEFSIAASVLEIKFTTGQREMPRRCVRAECTYDYPPEKLVSKPGFRALWAAYAGQTCDRDEHGGIVCPHRRASLGSLVAHDDVIRCPLHGLRINASTGVVLATAEGGA